MTVYTVEANTGSSVWPVASYEINSDVVAYLNAHTEFRPVITPGNAGMFQSVRIAEALAAAVSARDTGVVTAEDAQIHDKAISQLVGLLHLTTTHHGAAVNWQAPNAPVYND